jgi:PKHD-type hydroxylase
VAHTGTTSWRTAAPLVTEYGIDSDLCTDLTHYADQAAHAPRTYQGVLDESLRKSDYTEIPGPLEERLFNQVKPALRRHFGVRVSLTERDSRIALRLLFDS